MGIETVAPWDAIVVGGGPGGSTAARRLARGGRRVLLLDAARFPRTKLCAGWVTPSVWRHVEFSPEDYPLTIQPFSRATVEIDGRVLETRWSDTVGWGIVRSEFDDFLLRRAREAGAEVREGTRVREVRREGDAVSVDLDGDEIRAPFVIGAGGHHCPVARALGEIEGGETVVAALESETRIEPGRGTGHSSLEPGPELFFEPDLRGYGWRFVKGDRLNVGLGCTPGGVALRRRCDSMLDRLGREGRLPADVPLERMRGHAYAVRLSAPRLVAGPGFLLVGDAAGLARGLSGEGIGPAVESAAVAAGLLLDGGVGRDEVAARYRREIDRRFGTGRPGRLARALAKLPRPAIEGSTRWIVRSGWLRRKLILERLFGMRPRGES